MVAHVQDQRTVFTLHIGPVHALSNVKYKIHCLFASGYGYAQVCPFPDGNRSIQQVYISGIIRIVFDASSFVWSYFQHSEFSGRIFGIHGMIVNIMLDYRFCAAVGIVIAHRRILVCHVVRYNLPPAKQFFQILAGYCNGIFDSLVDFSPGNNPPKNAVDKNNPVFDKIHCKSGACWDDKFKRSRRISGHDIMAGCHICETNAAKKRFPHKFVQTHFHQTINSRSYQIRETAGYTLAVAFSTTNSFNPGTR